MSSISCQNCGGSDFTSQDGRKVCSECGVYQLNFQELLDDQETWDVDYEHKHSNFLNSTVLSQEENNIDGGEKVSEDDFCIFEAYNIILKKWTDAVVHLGASKKFKDAVFRLWMLYVQQSKVAFVKSSAADTVNNKTFKSNESKSDASQSCSTARNKRAVSIHEVKKENTNDKSLMQRDARVLKGNNTRNKKIKKESVNADSAESCVKDIKKEIELKVRRSAGGAASIGETNVAVKTTYIADRMSRTLSSSEYFNIKIEKDEEIEEDVYQSNYESHHNLSFSESDEENVEEVEESKTENDGEKMMVVLDHRAQTQKWKIFPPGSITLPEMLGFLYLGLLIAEEDIMLSDLLRWCKEGYIPYMSAGYLLPSDKPFDDRDIQLFNQSLPPASEVRRFTASLAMFLSIQALPLPPFEKLIKRIVEALNMPEEVIDLAKRIINTFRITSHSNLSIPPFETLAAASILLAFKVYFGLDGVHEELLSDLAEKMNGVLEGEKRALRLFSWRKWHSHINRVDWWYRQLCPRVGRKANEERVGHVDAKRFSQYFWSEGMWKTPLTSQTQHGTLDKARSSALLHYTLGDNMASLKEALDHKRRFAPCNDVASKLRHYISEGYLHDPSNKKEQSLKIAKELSSKSFSEHSFNWLQNWEEINDEFSKFGKLFEFVQMPLSSNEMAEENIQKIKTSIDSFGAEGREKRKNPGGRSSLPRIIVPDPLKSYWTLTANSTTVLEDYLYSRLIQSLPQSFRWLLKTLSDLCETYETDIFSQFRAMEKKFLRHCVKHPHAFNSKEIISKPKTRIRKKRTLADL